MARDTVERLWISIVGLGARRLIALAFIGVAVMVVLGVGTYYLSRPQQEVLYTGLTRDDVARIGSALKDAGIDFDVNADGQTVTVNYGDTARARMLLAEKGLPESANSGYDLFDKVGSFGLTSFMQNVTKTRALEGELARTIQGMDGIRSARVHLVLPDSSSLRSQQQAASASVVIRTDMPTDTGPAQAIRHLVAAAVPGLKVDNVTVLNTEGQLLASGDDIESASAGKMAIVEQTVNREIEDKVRRTLTPYLGLGNFQVSVVGAAEPRPLDHQRGGLRSVLAGGTLGAHGARERAGAELVERRGGQRAAEPARPGQQQAATTARTRTRPTTGAKRRPTTKSPRARSRPRMTATRSSACRSPCWSTRTGSMRSPRKARMLCRSNTR